MDVLASDAMWRQMLERLFSARSALEYDEISDALAPVSWSWTHQTC